MNVILGKHAIVTGGNRGIGLAVASALEQRGARVSIVSRSAPAAGKASVFVQARADVADETQITAAFDACRKANGPIAILVNNAGIAESAPLVRTDTQMWNRIIATNLTGTFLCTRAAAPDMLAAKWGRIVNIASIAGLFGAPYIAAYCASKHGVIGLTRAAAAEFAQAGITVNAICPGYVETDMMAQAIARIVEHTGVSESVAREQLAQMNPEGRIVAPEEVADAVVAYCEGTATGESLVLPGGTRS
jgi:NAD(P)-dependent dehydrogenase (short-subunit alcohol dehydrogenase family)